MSKNKAIRIRLDESEREKLAFLSSYYKRTMSDYIRVVIDTDYKTVKDIIERSGRHGEEIRR